MELAQIEADVVVVLENVDLERMRTLPLWECEFDVQQLREFVARESLTFAEACGGGFVDATVFDYRTPEDFARINERRNSLS